MGTPQRNHRLSHGKQTNFEPRKLSKEQPGTCKTNKEVSNHALPSYKALYLSMQMHGRQKEYLWTNILHKKDIQHRENYRSSKGV